MKQIFEVTGMSCAACQARVERVVRALPGITRADVNLLQNTLQVEFTASPLIVTQIQEAVRRAGYGISLRSDHALRRAPVAAGQTETARLKRRFWLSCCFLIPLVYISSGPMGHWPGTAHLLSYPVLYIVLQFLLTMPVVWLNRAFFTRGLKNLVALSPNMDSLVALGAGAAIVSGVGTLLLGRGTYPLYLESAAMILTLVTLGKWLESRAKAKTSDAISALIQLLPATVHILRDNAEETVSVEKLAVGDILVVRAGERVAADATVTQGTGAADESALTGESLPQDKLENSLLTAGTLLVSGYVQARVNRVGRDTTLAQLVALVEQAAGSKAPIAQVADRVSAVFVPVVLAIAFVTLVGWLLAGVSFSFALSCAVSVLVISCPCALGLATPTALMVGLGKAAKNGVLIKSAAALEQAHAVRTVVLDKTGTITTGKMQVVRVCPAAGVSRAELLSVAASLEDPSSHPFARALVAYAQAQHAAIFQTADFTSVPGLGVRAVEGNQPLAGGNLTGMKEWQLKVKDGEQIVREAATQGATPLFFAKGMRVLGSIWFADTVKPNAPQGVEELKQLRLQTVLLTGDNEYAANWVAKQVGISHVIAGVLPQEKEAVIRHLQTSQNGVAMVGDGINDAPALVCAEVGIALGTGTDVAVESADVVLMKDDLRGVAAAIRLSRAVMRNIKQNLFWAFFYNVLGIPLAAGVFYPVFGWKLSPVFAAAAMSLSSVCVVSNALRLRFFKFPMKNNTNKGKNMHKTLVIQGMTCGHCAAHVARALNALPGVQARVDLARQVAIVQAAQDVPDEVLKQAVLDAGYEVVAIE